jgi:hypothetical protein
MKVLNLPEDFDAILLKNLKTDEEEDDEMILKLLISRRRKKKRKICCYTHTILFSFVI